MQYLINIAHILGWFTREEILAIQQIIWFLYSLQEVRKVEQKEQQEAKVEVLVELKVQVYDSDVAYIHKPIVHKFDVTSGL